MRCLQGVREGRMPEIKLKVEGRVDVVEWKGVDEKVGVMSEIEERSR